MLKNSLRLFATTALVVGLSASAYAQAVPSSAEPSRVGGQITPMESPTLSKQAPSVSAGGAYSAPAGAENVKLILKSVSIDGMTAYQKNAVDYIYADMIGTQITLADVYGIAEKLTAKYRNEGYVLTQVVVPPQTIDGGNIKLRVVEGFIDQVNIQGKTQADIAYLTRFTDKIKVARPLNAKALERYILLINDMSGMTAKAVLSPSATVPGASDVTLVVDQKPMDFFMQMDNRGSRYLGAFQTSVGARFNNLIGQYESLNIQVVTAPDGWPERELDYIGATWAHPIGSEGTKLTLSGSVTSTQPGFDLEVFDVEGVAHNFGIEVSHPFIRSRNYNLFGSVKFNYLDSERNDNLGLPKTEDRLRVLRAGGTWQFTDKFVGINTLTGELSKGLDTLGSSDRGDANMTRANGKPDFFKATFEVSRLQRLTERFELFASATGQATPHTLLASEEFGVGGVSYGSAYDNSEITGESGLAGRLEVRGNNLIATPFDLFQSYAYYDLGRVWDRDATVAKDEERSVASSGVGFRVTFNETLSGSLEYAFPLTREVETEDDTDARAFGSLTARF